MAIAWSPATPAPMTSTRAGRDRAGRRRQHGEEPRQHIGGDDDRLVAGDRRHRGKRVHALARVVRGISSTENEVTPRSAISRMVSIDPSGRRKPIRTWSRRKQGKVVLAGPVVRAVAQHLDDDVGRAEDLGAVGQDLGALGGVFGVGIAGLGAGPRFHDDLEAGLHQVRNHRGDQRHAALAGKALSRDSDDHETGSDRETPGSVIYGR